ncbi:MAG: SUMF1/EgtB/PvdO family nonheme iron enzyme [Deltaproteobacteria bacterium]|nr:SUMF1/EgtB/PvdO family nonheme iron enzyme [Deltaproteobacteria bacterium]
MIPLFPFALALPALLTLGAAPAPAKPTPAQNAAPVGYGMVSTPGVNGGPPLLVGEAEVTEALWRAVTGATLGSAGDAAAPLRGDSRPAHGLSWCDAVAFANALSLKEGLAPVYTGVERCESTEGASVRWDPTQAGHRLPTEAEWLALAAAGQDGPYAGGAGPADLCAIGNIADQALKRTLPSAEGVLCDDGAAGLAPVRSFKPNPWGLYDMTGNVAEWCWDGEGEGGAPAEPAPPPLITSVGVYRAVRGGYWGAVPAEATISVRRTSLPTARRDAIRLRLVRGAVKAPGGA